MVLSPDGARRRKKVIEMDKVGHISRNILLAYEPPHRLAFTFGPEARGYSEVEFRREQKGDPKDNKVRFTLTHSKILDNQYAVDVSGGWHSDLAILEEKARDNTPPAFWDVWRRYEGVYGKRYD